MALKGGYEGYASLLGDLANPAVDILGEGDYATTVAAKEKLKKGGNVMEAAVLFLYGALLYAQSWDLFRLTSPRTTAIVGAGVGISLIGFVLFKPLNLLTQADPWAILSGVPLLGIYALLLAATGLWDFDRRAMGLFAALLGVLSLAFALYFSVTVPSLWLAVGGVLLALALALYFVLEGLQFRARGFELLTAWITLIVGIVWSLMAGGVFLRVITL